MRELDGLLQRVGLRAADDTPQTVFSQLVNRLKRLFRIKTIEQSTTFSQEGMPILTAKMEFENSTESGEDEIEGLVRHDEALQLLQRAVSEEGLKVWLIMDRLDEAFQGRSTTERPALRALFRTYLDMLELPNVRVKLFVRRDLFARIISGGFVNLTHINARRIDITWDEDDLYDLLYRRVRESKAFLEHFDASLSNEEVFQVLFPEQVDPGDRKPSTFTWIMGRIRDGNDVKPPRNLIDLILKARESQLRREERALRSLSKGDPLISSDALKRGLEALSAERVQDTLLAEAGDDAHLIELFRNGKAEHNSATLRSLLGEDTDGQVDLLKTLGFLEPVGNNFKVPMLYRGGHNITQGRAFSSTGPAQSEE